MNKYMNMKLKNYLMIIASLTCLSFVSCEKSEDKNEVETADDGELFRPGVKRASDGHLYFILDNNSVMLTRPLQGGSDFDAWNNMTSYVFSERVEIDGKVYAVTHIDSNTFGGCTSLRSLTIPEGVIEIDDEAFMGCSSLVSITLPSTLEELGGLSFVGCSSLTSLTVLSKKLKASLSTIQKLNHLTSLTLCCHEIGHSTFSDYTELTEVILKDGVEFIGSAAFQGCKKLILVDLPASIKTINPQAFCLCPMLTDVYCRTSEVLNISEDVFDWNLSDNLTLHVPSALLNDYKAHKAWGRFHRIVAI
jgi:hypothetical protein